MCQQLVVYLQNPYIETVTSVRTNPAAIWCGQDPHHLHLAQPSDGHAVVVTSGLCLLAVKSSCSPVSEVREDPAPKRFLLQIAKTARGSSEENRVTLLD